MFFGKNETGQGPAPGSNNETPDQGLKDKARRFWNELEAVKKRRLAIAACMALVLIFSAWGYTTRQKDKKNETPDQKTAVEHEISMDPGMMEKSLYTRALDDIQRQQDLIRKLSDKIEDLENAPAVPSRDMPLPEEPGKEQVKKGFFSFPPSPPPPAAVAEPPPPPPDKEEFKLVGGIEIVENSKKPESSEKQGKKKQHIYLPPSFMEASLLSGVAAPTTTAAKGNPLPVLLRIKDLAVLPNQVKANLKGCFVIGEAAGNLAAERVHIRLLTLSCVSKKGKAVIDQSVKGFVVDEDGKVGLAGKVVAKMGMHIARSALAGFLGGAGEAVEESSLNTDYSPVTGTTTRIWSNTDTTHIAKAGIGKGISNAAKELQKFYLQLAEQTMPVIEVGSTKTVTAVISEGTKLDIKEYNSNRDS